MGSLNHKTNPPTEMVPVKPSLECHPHQEDKDKDIHEVIGSFGLWQKKVFVIFFIINIVGIFQNFSITFQAPNVDYWCIEPRSNSNTSGNVTRTEEMYKKCEVSVLVSNSSHAQRNVTVPCTKWEYNIEEYSQTIISEWDLVCDKEWLISLAKSVYMIGFLISVIFFGQFSDCLGRFPAIAVSYIITIVSMFMSLWSGSYLMFAILRFFLAFGRTGLTTTGFVLLMELIGPSHHTMVGVTIQTGWPVGLVILPLLAYYIRNWFWFQLATSIPLVPLVLFYRMIPESPRWLLMQGKRKRLENTLIKATAQNKQDLKCEIKDLSFMKDSENPKEEHTTKTIIDVFRAPKMRKRALNMIYLWIVNAFMYYALSYNTNDLAGNPYLNFFISGVLEFPSYVIVYYGIKLYGRRPTLVLLMLVGGVACGAIVFVPYNLAWLSTTFAMIGKFCITGSFGILYIYTTELFPTVVRNVMLGTCSMCARVGSILAPFVKELGQATYFWVPNAAYFVLAVSSGLLALLLPETKDKKVLDTLQDGENL